MERLTSRDENGRVQYDQKLIELDAFYGKMKTSDYCIVKLAHLEDLQDQGRLIELPCKVGDTLYIIYDNKICTAYVFLIEIIGGISIYCRTLSGSDRCGFKPCLSDFGKTAFLTEHEAMKAVTQ